jgi:hypothetical protein
MERAPSAALTKIEDIYFRMTQTEPLLGVYLKAINDTFEALSLFLNCYHWYSLNPLVCPQAKA